MIGTSYTLHCEPEEIPYKGNCSAIDDDTDREVEAWICDQLKAGNGWAWCTAVVRCEIDVDGSVFMGEAVLGCCSYSSQLSFVTGPYYEDLQREAYEGAIRELRNAVERGLRAQRALNRLKP